MQRDRFSAAMDQCRQAYQDTPIPEELERKVENAIRAGRQPRSSRRWARQGAAWASGLCACFLLVLNTAPSFAQAMYQVPVLGELCRVFTFRSYQEEENASWVQVVVPQVELKGKDQLEQRVNLEISTAIDREVEASKARGREYYQAYLDTGGDPADYHPILVQVDYEVKSVAQNRLSFVITKTETLASAYTRFYFYNLDLETGKELTLRDLLGPDYAAIAAGRIRQELESWSPEEQAQLFEGVDLESLIQEDRGFYIEEDGTIMVVFEKYEIAVGAAGVLEFPIGTLPQA